MRGGKTIEHKRTFIGKTLNDPWLATNRLKACKIPGNKRKECLCIDRKHQQAIGWDTDWILPKHPDQ